MPKKNITIIINPNNLKNLTYIIIHIEKKITYTKKKKKNYLLKKKKLK